MYSYVLSAKYKIIENKFEASSTSYSLLMYDIELCIWTLEMIGIANGLLDKQLPKSQIAKLISVAMGIMPPSDFDHKGYSSLYPVYSITSQKIAIKETVKEYSIEQLNNIFKYSDECDEISEKNPKIYIPNPVNLSNEMKEPKKTSDKKIADSINMEDSSLNKSQQLNMFLSNSKALKFLLKFGICDVSCFDYLMTINPNVIKSKPSHISYSGLMRLMLMPTLCNDNKKGYAKLEMKDALSDFLTLLSSSAKLNVMGTRSILNLIHGNYHKSYLEEFSNKFQINIDFLESTFLYKQEYIDVQNKAYALLATLRIEEQVNKLLITNVIGLYHRNKEGVKKMIHYSSKSKSPIYKSRQISLVELINNFSWEHIKSSNKNQSAL